MIVTSFYPMYIATLNIVDGIEGVTVINLTENQTGCIHDYQLTTQDMRDIAEANIAVINGGDLEEFMEEVLADHHRYLIWLNRYEPLYHLICSSVCSFTKSN